MDAEGSNTEGNENLSSRSVSRGPGRPPGGGDSRQAILEAAGKAFIRDGLNASTRDIAAEAGVTQAALYHYFPTKQDLLREAAKGASRFFEQVGAMAVPEGEPEEVFRRLAESYLGIFATVGAPQFLATMMVEGMKMPGFMPEMAQRLQGGAVGPTIAYLQTLRAEGRISPEVQPAMIGQMLFGTLFSFLMARDVLKAPWVQNLDPAEVARQVAYVLMYGMGGRADHRTDADPASGADSDTGDDPGTSARQQKGTDDEVA